MSRVDISRVNSRSIPFLHLFVKLQPLRFLYLHCNRLVKVKDGHIWKETDLLSASWQKTTSGALFWFANHGGMTSAKNGPKLVPFAGMLWHGFSYMMLKRRGIQHQPQISGIYGGSRKRWDVLTNGSPQPSEVRSPQAWLEGTPQSGKTTWLTGTNVYWVGLSILWCAKGEVNECTSSFGSPNYTPTRKRGGWMEFLIGPNLVLQFLLLRAEIRRTGS